jgi:hypothetical protein
MKKETVSLGIDKITFTFSKTEVLDALLKEYKIKLTHDYEFDWDYDDKGNEEARLIVKYTKEVDKK